MDAYHVFVSLQEILTPSLIRDFQAQTENRRPAPADATAAGQAAPGKTASEPAPAPPRSCPLL
jgi:hypothetical protein